MREALHNGWDKNDPKDDQVILHMLRIGANQRYVDPLAAGVNDLQELSKTHEVTSQRQSTDRPDEGSAQAMRVAEEVLADPS